MTALIIWLVVCGMVYGAGWALYEAYYKNRPE